MIRRETERKGNKAHAKDRQGDRDTFGIAKKLGGSGANVVAEASKTLRNIRSIYIKEFSVSVDGKKVTSYRVNAKVTFEMERGSSGKS